MKLKTFCTLAVLSAAAHSAHGQIFVDWGAGDLGATFFSGSQDPGNAIDATGVVYELGIFAPTFTPSLSNAADWSMNWLSLDSAEFPSAATDFSQNIQFGPVDGPGAPNNIQTGGATSFPVGSQIFIWAYRDGVNTIDPSSGVRPEWALLTKNNVVAMGDDPNLLTTNNWVIPASTGAAVTSHGPTTRNLFISVADQPIVGSSTPNGNLVFEAVPEPSTALFTVLAAFGLLRRRRQG